MWSGSAKYEVMLQEHVESKFTPRALPAFSCLIIYTLYVLGPPHPRITSPRLAHLGHHAASTSILHLTLYTLLPSLHLYLPPPFLVAMQLISDMQYKV